MKNNKLLVVRISFNLDNPEKTTIKTNAKKDAIKEMLETWLCSQMGQGKDTSKVIERPIYEIEIKLDLTEDTFYVKSDTGNESMTCGLVMYVRDKLDTIQILDLD